jgi:4-hydroxyphenylpyruvate dioxygenase-like putative hemolysin
VKLKTYKLKSKNNEIIELLKFKKHKDKKNWKGKIYSTGLTHIAFTVKNLERTYNNLKKRGVKFKSKPQNSPDGYAKVAFCSGPENLMLELVELR